MYTVQSSPLAATMHFNCRESVTSLYYLLLLLLGLRATHITPSRCDFLRTTSFKRRRSTFDLKVIELAKLFILFPKFDTPPQSRARA